MYSLVCSKYPFVGLIMLYVMNYSVHVRIISFLRLIPHLDSWNISGQKQDQDTPIYWFILHWITYVYILLLENNFLMFCQLENIWTRLEYILQLFLANFKKGSSRLTIETSKIILIICSSLHLVL